MSGVIEVWIVPDLASESASCLYLLPPLSKVDTPALGVLDLLLRPARKKEHLFSGSIDTDKECRRRLIYHYAEDNGIAESACLPVPE